DVPQSDGPIIATGEQLTLVGREGKATDGGLGVPFKMRQLLAGGHIPAADSPVPAAGGEAAAVLEERHGAHLVLVAGGLTHQADLFSSLLRSWGQCAPTGLYFRRAERAVIDGNLVQETAEEPATFCLPHG